MFIFSKDETRLRRAAGSGCFQMVQKLLEMGIDPNSADEMGRTPLHVAACKGFSDIVGLLVTSGANPNLRDCVGNTVKMLYIAVTYTPSNMSVLW